MRPWMVGGALLAALVLGSSCRKDNPPQIIICIGDGSGGADCDIPNVGKEYWPPSKLAGMWMTTQEDMGRFAAWCYDTDQETAIKALEQIRTGVRDE